MDMLEKIIEKQAKELNVDRERITCSWGAGGFVLMFLDGKLYGRIG